MRSWIIAGALIIALIGAYGVYALKAGEGANAPKTPAASAPAAALASVKDIYSKGTHTVSGIVLAPDACTEVETTVATSSGPSLYLVTPADDGICLQLPTEVSFSAAVDAGATTSVRVYLNEQLATTTNPVAAPPPPTKKK
jgi:hypothetical protein